MPIHHGRQPAGLGRARLRASASRTSRPSSRSSCPSRGAESRRIRAGERTTRRTRAVLGVLLLSALADHARPPRRRRLPLGALRGRRRGRRSARPNGRRPRSSAPVGRFFGDHRRARAHRRRIDALREGEQRPAPAAARGRLDRTARPSCDRLLRSAGHRRVQGPAGQVIRAGHAGFEETVTVDAGSRDGVRPDMTVMTGDGLVGRVNRVGSATATVLLAIDPGLRGRRPAGGLQQIGIAHGRGPAGNGAAARSGSAAGPDRPVEVGHRLVTLGSQRRRPYVAGRADRRGRPGRRRRRGRLPGPRRHGRSSSFTSLDLVGVVVAPPKKDPRDTVLPPARPRRRPRADADPSTRSRRRPEAARRGTARGTRAPSRIDAGGLTC